MQVQLSKKQLAEIRKMLRPYGKLDMDSIRTDYSPTTLTVSYYHKDGGNYAYYDANFRITPDGLLLTEI